MSTVATPIQRASIVVPTINDLNQAIVNSIKDPVLFAENWLGVTLWDTQKQILKSLTTHRKTAVKACHASSKTFTAAVATLWFLACHKEAVVISTAPTQRQVESVLWSEIAGLVAKSKYPFPKPTLTKLTMGPKRFAFGFTTSVDAGGEDSGVKFQGYHSTALLVICDEAPGIAGMIWQAIEGILSAGDVRLLALGNPTIGSGPFYDAFGVKRETWNPFSISAFDTPNLRGVTLKQLLEMSKSELEVNPAPYLVSRSWVKEMYKEWGENHPLWKSRVLGEFPSQGADALLSLEWLEKAKNRQSFGLVYKKLVAGIDVAGPGEDETVLVIRADDNIVFIGAWADPDPRGEIVAVLNKFKRMYEHLAASFAINVDSAGIGYYLARHLEDLRFLVYDVNVGERPDDREKFVNKKAEFYWALRMRLESGEMTGLSDDTTIAQLAGIRYKINSRGQTEIETKEKARERGVKSPDRAEAIMLAFAPSREHGLFALWQEQSEASPVGKLSAGTEQKEVQGFADMHRDSLGTKEGKKSLGKVTTAPQQVLSVCPNCDSRFFSLNAEGVGRCGCGYVGNPKVAN